MARPANRQCHRGCHHACSRHLVSLKIGRQIQIQTQFRSSLTSQLLPSSPPSKAIGPISQHIQSQRDAHTLRYSHQQKLHQSALRTSTSASRGCPRHRPTTARDANLGPADRMAAKRLAAASGSAAASGLTEAWQQQHPRLLALKQGARAADAQRGAKAAVQEAAFWENRIKLLRREMDRTISKVEALRRQHDVAEASTLLQDYTAVCEGQRLGSGCGPGGAWGCGRWGLPSEPQSRLFITS